MLATPLLLYAVGMKDAHVAIGTSAAAVAVNAAVGLVAQAKAGRVKWPCALAFGAPDLAGSLVGAHVAKALPGDTLLVWFAVAPRWAWPCSASQPRPAILTSISTPARRCG